MLGTLILAALLAVQASTDADGLDRVLVDASLERRAIGAPVFEGDRVRFLSARGESSLPIDGGVIAIADASGVAPEPRGAWVELIDGQRIVGSPPLPGDADARRPGSEDTLAWSSPLLGELALPIEAVQRVVLDDSATAAPLDELADVLVYVNGDVVRGIVEEIGDEVVVDIDGMVDRVPLAYLTSFSLANPPRPPRGTRVWLADGSVVQVDRLRSLADGVRLDPSEAMLARDTQPPPPLRPGEVLAVAFESGNVVPLVRLGLPEIEAVGGRRWAPPPRAGDADRALLGAPAIEISGPTEASWTVPADARRLSLRVRLRPDGRTWGDCLVRVSVDGMAEGASVVRLWGERPEADFVVDLPGGTPRTLRLAIEAGERGTIQDRVLLDGLVLTGG
ncbi:MAG: hypothetical protein AAFX79_11825 [Planctomycetota bacterium]